MSLLKLENVEVSFESKGNVVKALDNVSFNVNEGEFISIVGPSGCGKTTLLKVIGGLLKPTKGKIDYSYQQYIDRKYLKKPLVNTFISGGVDGIGTTIIEKFISEDALKKRLGCIRANSYTSLGSMYLMTKQKLINSNPYLVQSFVRATHRGIEYAIKNPEDAVETYIKYDPKFSKKKDLLLNIWKEIIETGFDKSRNGDYLCSWPSEDKWNEKISQLYNAGLVSETPDSTKLYTDQFAKNIDLPSQKKHSKENLKNVVLMLSYFKEPFFLPFYVSKDKGFYSYEGINLKIRYLHETSNNALKLFMDSKDTHFLNCGDDGLITNNSANGNVVGIYRTIPKNLFCILTHNANKLKELKGKVIGFPSTFSTPETILKIMFSESQEIRVDDVVFQYLQASFVFQDATLLPWRNVIGNIVLPLEIRHHKNKENFYAEARKLLDMVNLEKFETLYPDELSGGMKQRVSISRALISEPLLLLMDEPFGALDELTRTDLNIELNQIWRKTKKTVILITHSIPEAVFLSQRIIVLSKCPGTIKNIIDIKLPEKRDAYVLDNNNYFKYVKKVRKILDGLKHEH